MRLTESIERLFCSGQREALAEVFSGGNGLIVFSSELGRGKAYVANEVIGCMRPDVRQGISSALADIENGCLFVGEIRTSDDLKELVNRMDEVLCIATVLAPDVGGVRLELERMGLTTLDAPKVKAIVHCCVSGSIMKADVEFNPYVNA